MRDLFSLITTLSISLIFLSQIPSSSCQTLSFQGEDITKPYPFLYNPQRSGVWTELPSSHLDSIFSKFTNKKGLVFLSAISWFNSYLVLLDSEYVDHERFIIICLNINYLKYSNHTLRSLSITYQIGDDFYNFDNMTSHSCTVEEVAVEEINDPSNYREWDQPSIKVKFTGGDCPFSFETNFLTKQVQLLEKFKSPYYNLVKANHYYGKWFLNTTTGADQLIPGWNHEKEGVAMTYFGLDDGRPYLELLDGKYLNDNSYFGFESKASLDLANGKSLNEKYKGYVTIFLNLLEEIDQKTGIIKKENHLIQYTFEIQDYTCIAKELTITLSGPWDYNSIITPTIHIKVVMEENCPLASFETNSLLQYNELTSSHLGSLLKVSFIWVILSVIANLAILKGPRDVDHLKPLQLTAIINMYCYEQMVSAAAETLGPVGLTSLSFLLMSVICFEIYVIIMGYPSDEIFVLKVQNVLWFFGLRFLIYMQFLNNPFIPSRIFFVIPLMWITCIFAKQLLKNDDLPRYPYKLLPSILLTVYINFYYKDFMGLPHHPSIQIAIALFFVIYCGSLMYWMFFKRRQEYNKVNVSTPSNVVYVDQQNAEDVEEGQ